MTLDDKSLQKVLNKQQNKSINKQQQKEAYKMVQKELETLDKADDCQSLTVTEMAQAALAVILLGIMGVTTVGMIFGIQSSLGLFSVGLTILFTGAIVSDTFQDSLLRQLIDNPKVE